MIETRSRTKDVLERHDRFLFPAVHPYFGEHAVVVDRAKDSWLWDVEGTKYLDFFGGVLTVSVGHCNDEVTHAIETQLRKAQHTSTLFVNEIMVDVAEMLARITPGRLQKSFFHSSGSEANETAIMAARMYTGNSTVLTLRHAYSGRTMVAMSLTAHSTWRLGGVFDGNIKHVRNPYTYRAPLGLSEDEVLELCVQDLEETIATVTSGRIAAFMAEPIQGVGGFIVAPQKYFQRIEPIVRDAGGVIIIDEVQTGWARTGKHMCGIEHWGIEPDIMTFAKGMANGSPIGATIATPEVADAVQGLTFSTFGGNPVTMAAAKATIEYIEAHELWNNAERQGGKLRETLETLVADHDFVGDARGMGLMQGVEIIVPDDEKTPDPARTTAIMEACRERGLLIGKGGLNGNVLRIAPMLTVTDEEMAQGVDIIAQAVASVA